MAMNRPHGLGYRWSAKQSPAAKRSWWIGLDRPAFASVLAVELPRMAASKAAAWTLSTLAHEPRKKTPTSYRYHLEDDRSDE